MGLKSDTSFLEKLAIGAIGAKRVHEDLRAHGHEPIELERGSTSYKLWKKIKIKRVRLPDILCTRCGTRVESRGKTEFEISMSHSKDDAERAWDYGLEDSDCAAVVVCRRSGPRPIDFVADELVQYVKIGDMRQAHKAGLTIESAMKSSTEGNEIRLIWPTAVAKYPCRVTDVNPTTIKFARDQGSRGSYVRLTQHGKTVNALVTVSTVVAENQALASVVPITRHMPCQNPVANEFYLAKLQSTAISDRFTGAKVLSRFEGEEVAAALLNRVCDSREHIYVRLEAAAGLARRSNEAGWKYIEECLASEFLTSNLEAVIVLSEVASQRAQRYLCEVLTSTQYDADVRAGAAWALGECGGDAALGCLVASFAEVAPEIRIEAARALAKLGQAFTPQVLGLFSSADEERKPGVAWALSKSRTLKLDELLPVLGTGLDARHWGAYIIGRQERARFVEGMERIKEADTELYFAVTLLWKIISSWVHDLEEYG